MIWVWSCRYRTCWKLQLSDICLCSCFPGVFACWDHTASSPDADLTGLENALGFGIYKSSPGDSSVQISLGTTAAIQGHSLAHGIVSPWALVQVLSEKSVNFIWVRTAFSVSIWLQLKPCSVIIGMHCIWKPMICIFLYLLVSIYKWHVDMPSSALNW